MAFVVTALGKLINLSLIYLYTVHTSDPIVKISVKTEIHVYRSRNLHNVLANQIYIFFFKYKF